MISKKEYLPGYTGFVAGKKDVYGHTVGETSKQLKQKSATFENPAGTTGINIKSKAFYSFKPAPVDQDIDRTLGNRSKEGATWIGGHTQMLKPQHIPGYKGHVPGIHSENLYAKTFGNTTSAIMCKEHTVGNTISNEERYTTTTRGEFSHKNFRRLTNDDEPLGKKDKDDFEEYFSTMGIDPIELARLPTEQRAIDDLPTVGYSGHQSMYRHNLYKKMGNVNFLDISPMRAKLRSVSNVDLRSTQDYQNLSNGFKTIVDKNTDLTQKSIKLPVVGYSGHRPGNKAQNFYGKPFRECSMQSKWIENMRGQ